MPGRKDTPITLIASCNNDRDADGFLLEGKKKKTNMFCSLDSVRRGEFYEAQKDGILLDAAAAINKYDYEMSIVTEKQDGKTRKIKPSRAYVDGVEYEIVRETKAGQDIILMLKEVE